MSPRNICRRRLPSIEIAWLRFLVFALIMVAGDGAGLAAVRDADLAARPAIDARRRAAGLVAVLHHGACAILPIAEASATGFVAPLFVTALSIFFLSEKVGVRRWLATATGLLGVLIILRPGTGAFHAAAFFPLISALAWAVTLIMTRMMSGREHAITIMTYSSIAGVCDPVGAGAVRLGRAELARRHVRYPDRRRLDRGTVDRGARVPLCRRLGARAVFLHATGVGRRRWAS